MLGRHGGEWAGAKESSATALGLGPFMDLYVSLGARPASACREDSASSYGGGINALLTLISRVALDRARPKMAPLELMLTVSVVAVRLRWKPMGASKLGSLCLMTTRAD